MHIAHFTNTYKPNINGVVRSVSSFRDALTNLGHQVFVFSHEIVTNGVTGLLVENDPHALAQGINQVMGNGALFGRLKTAATKKSRAFDISAAARKLVGVYEQAVEDKKANRSIKINTVLLEEGNYQLIPSQNS